MKFQPDWVRVFEVEGEALTFAAARRSRGERARVLRRCVGAFGNTTVVFVVCVASRSIEEQEAVMQEPLCSGCHLAESECDCAVRS